MPITTIVDQFRVDATGGVYPYYFGAQVTKLANGNFVVAWSNSADSYDQMFRVFSPDGVAITGESRANTVTVSTQIRTNVTALGDGGFIVFWEDYSGIPGDGTGSSVVKGRQFNSDGTPAGPEYLAQTTHAGPQDNEGATELLDGGVVIAWYTGDARDPSIGVAARIFNRDGTPRTDDFLLNTTTAGTQSEVRVGALTDGGFVAAWYNNGTIQARIFNSDGSARTVADFATGLSGSYPSVTGLSDGGFAISVNGRVGIFNSTGGIVANIPAGTSQHQAEIVSLSNGTFLVAWATGAGVFAQQFSNAGAALASPYTVFSGSAHYARIESLGGGDFVVSWTNSAGQQFAEILRTDFNRAPTVSNAIADHSSAEDAALSYQIPENAFSDPDGNTLTYTATLANDAALPAWLTFSAATRTFSGTPPRDFNGTLSLKVTASDGTLNTSDTFDLNITAVNDAPVNTVPSAQTMAEDGSLVFSTANDNAIRIADVDAGPDALMVVSLSATNGTLTLGSTTGLAFTTGDGTADATMTVTGTQAAINAALQGLRFNPGANFNGAADVTISTNDQGQTGTGGSKQDADTISVTVTPVNDAPTVAVAGPQIINEQLALSTSGRSISHFVQAENFSLSEGATLTGFTVSLLETSNSLEGTFEGFSGTLSWAIYQVNGSGLPSTLIATGADTSIPLVDTAANLDGLDTFQAFIELGAVPLPAGNYWIALHEGSWQSPADATTIYWAESANDVTGIGRARTDNETNPNGTFVAQPESLAFSLTRAPFTAVESTPLDLRGQIGVADIDAGALDITVRLQVVSGVINATPGTSGVVISGSGTSSVLLTGSLAEVQALLASGGDGSVDYRIDNDTPPSSDLLTVTVNDGGATGGGELSATTTAIIGILPVNDAPANTVPSAQTVGEDGSLVFSTANGNAISIADVDAGSGNMVVSLSATNGTLTLGSTAGLVFTTGDGTADTTMTVTGMQAAINAALQGLTFTPNANYNGAADVTISTNDQGQTGTGGSRQDADTISVTVTPVNDAPTVANAIANHSSPEDTVVSYQIPADAFADIDSATLTYTAALANDAALPAWLSFNAATRTFSGTPPQDYNGTIALKVTASDGSLSVSDTFDLAITPVNDRPVVNPSATEYSLSATSGVLDLSSVGGSPVPSIIPMNDGGYTVIWQGTSGGVPRSLQQRYDANHNEVGSEAVVSGATGESFSLDAASLGSGYVVVYSERANSSASYEIRAQVHDGNGQKVGSSFQVNQTTVGTQQAPQVEALSNGTFAATWMSGGQDGSGQGVYARVFNTNGTAVSNEFRVNTTTSGDQLFPQIGQYAGGFVVVWDDYSQSQTGDINVYAQRYSNAGVPIGGEFQVNQFSQGFQYTGLVTGLTDGGFVVTWTSQIGDDLQVYARKYGADGNPVGNEFLVNRPDAGIELFSNVLALPDGGFMVFWKDGNEGNSSYARRFDAAGVPMTDELAIGPKAFQFEAALISNGDVVVVAKLEAGATVQRFVIDLNSMTVTPALPDRSFAEDTGLYFQVPADAFADVDGDTLTYVAALDNGDPLPSWLTFTAGTRTFSGTPPLNVNGNLSITVTASDGALGVSDTFNLVITPVNDAPVTVNEADSYAENAAIVKDVVANDTDVDDANAELTVGTANVRGSAPLSNGLTLGADGRALTFDQNAYQHVVNGQTVTGFDYLAAGETATVEIDYNVKDSDGANSSSVTNPPYGTFTVTIVGVNDAPAATNLSAPETYTEDTPLNLTNIVASDVDSANLTVTLTLSNPAVGALSIGTSGSVTSSYNAGTGVWTASGATADVNALLAGVTFNPAANFNGSFTVATSVSDGVAPAITGTKTFTGVAVEDPATAVRDSFITSEGSTLHGSVYANNGFGPDTDPDSTIDPVTAINGEAALVGSTITLSTGSTVRLNADGTVTFTPAATLSSLAVAGSGASNTQVNESVIYTLAGGSFAVAMFTVDGIDNADTLLGTPGDDSMNAGIMDDVLIGYTGADVLNGGTGSDTASYAPDEGGVFVNLTLGQGYGNAAQGDTYISIENVIGTSYNDFIIGDTGVNRLDGGAGNDTLIGAIGGDALFGGSGTDTASYEDNSGTVFVNLTLKAGSNNAAQGDSYDGIENLIGSLFDDFFIGDEQANRLDGAMGADTLLGAGGADTFVFKHAAGAASGFTHPNSSANVDTILDFQSGVDKIELSRSAFGALDIGNLNPNAFVLGTAAQDADDRIIYDQATGKLYYDADGSGSGTGVLFAVLDNKPPLAATDFAIAP